MIDMIEKEDPVISEEEAAQYDRQIRLWGLDAQKRSVSSVSSQANRSRDARCRTLSAPVCAKVGFLRTVEI